eukprot:361014-Chlamydomonas_euryale.AAC.8
MQIYLQRSPAVALTSASVAEPPTRKPLEASTASLSVLSASPSAGPCVNTAGRSTADSQWDQCATAAVDAGGFSATPPLRSGCGHAAQTHLSEAQSGHAWDLRNGWGHTPSIFAIELASVRNEPSALLSATVLVSNGLDALARTLARSAASTNATASPPYCAAMRHFRACTSPRRATKEAMGTPELVLDDTARYR